MSVVGENLKKLRKDSNLTLLSLSEKTDVPISTISDIENGRTSIGSDRTLRKLASGLNVVVADFWKE